MQSTGSMWLVNVTKVKHHYYHQFSHTKLVGVLLSLSQTMQWDHMWRLKFIFHIIRSSSQYITVLTTTGQYFMDYFIKKNQKNQGFTGEMTLLGQVSWAWLKISTWQTKKKSYNRLKEISLTIQSISLSHQELCLIFSEEIIARKSCFSSAAATLSQTICDFTVKVKHMIDSAIAERFPEIQIVSYWTTL